MFSFNAKLKFLSFVTLTFVHVADSQAAITEVSPLSFGTIAVLKNDVVSEISISTTNQIFITNHIRVLIPGTRAEFFLSAYPAYTQLFTSANIVTTETFSPAPSSEQFTLTALTIAPSVTTDGAGTATIYVGGSIQTSGTGAGQYFDTDYLVNYELTINF